MINPDHDHAEDHAFANADKSRDDTLTMDFVHDDNHSGDDDILTIFLIFDNFDWGIPCELAKQSKTTNFI